MPAHPGLFDLVVCPVCHGRLAQSQPAIIVCLACRREYPVHEGIPVLIAPSPEPAS